MKSKAARLINGDSSSNEANSAFITNADLFGIFSSS